MQIKLAWKSTQTANGLILSRGLDYINLYAANSAYQYNC